MDLILHSEIETYPDPFITLTWALGADPNENSLKFKHGAAFTISLKAERILDFSAEAIEGKKKFIVASCCYHLKSPL